MWNWSQQHDFYRCWAKSCMGLPWVIPVIHWFCLKQLILSILSTFQLLKIWKINFAANHWEYVWNWSQQHDFHHCWAKNCMGIPWGIPEIHWFCLKQLILSILSTFQLLKIWKIKFCCKPLWISVKLVTTTWLSPVLGKKLHGNTLSHTWDTLILIKTVSFKHFEHFPSTENLKN